METLTLTITKTMNLFSKDLNKETLFNIGSSKAASKEATSFLLHVTDIGNRAPEEFIEECESNPRRYEERIKKQKIYTLGCLIQGGVLIIGGEGRQSLKLLISEGVLLNGGVGKYN